jgi:hypothetical protein
MVVPVFDRCRVARAEYFDDEVVAGLSEPKIFGCQPGTQHELTRRSCIRRNAIDYDVLAVIGLVNIGIVAAAPDQRIITHPLIVQQIVAAGAGDGEDAVEHGGGGGTVAPLKEFDAEAAALGFHGG